MKDSHWTNASKKIVEDHVSATTAMYNELERCYLRIQELEELVSDLLKVAAVGDERILRLKQELSVAPANTPKIPLDSERGANMSLYNMLFGTNALADVLLAVIELDRGAIPRFRDCSLNEDGTRVVVFTRTGGGNREAYEEENETLARHPLYLADRDDDFDSTYAYFDFSIPPQFQADLKELAAQGRGEGPAIGKFEALIGTLRAGKTDSPQVKRALEVGKNIMDKIQEQVAKP